MIRSAFLSVLMALGLHLAQGQVLTSGPPASALSFSGPPASALSPTPDGRLHGVPASVLSLKPVPAGVHQRVFFNATPHGPVRPFGSPHRRRREFVPVPLFYPAYSYSPYYDSPSTADPNVSEASDATPPEDDSASAGNEDALRQAYLQGARDAMRQELDSAQDKSTARPAKPTSPKDPPAAAHAPEPDQTPATVFIFKDGHQIEIRNFAIMGETLYDLSNSSVKKVQLSDLDTAATLKANDDRGLQFRLP